MEGNFMESANANEKIKIVRWKKTTKKNPKALEIGAVGNLAGLGIFRRWCWSVDG